MTKEDWESLSANPGWAALRRYLLDFRERIKEQWASGKFDSDSPYGVKAAIRCDILCDLADMNWATIEKFYAQDPNEP